MSCEISPQAWHRPGARLSNATDISYDCPAGGLDPFDVDETRTQHFYEARGWGRGWPFSAEADRAAFDEAYGVIPHGYKNLQCYEKLAIVDGGILIAEWDEFSPPDDSSPAQSSYRVLSQSINVVDRYQDERGDTFRGVARRAQHASGNKRLDGDYLTLSKPTYWEALLLALTLGEVIKSPLMVARLVSSSFWH